MNYNEVKQRILDRIKDSSKWPDNGEARMQLIQEAYNKGWWPS